MYKCKAGVTSDVLLNKFEVFPYQVSFWRTEKSAGYGIRPQILFLCSVKECFKDYKGLEMALERVRILNNEEYASYTVALLEAMKTLEYLTNI